MSDLLSTLIEQMEENRRHHDGQMSAMEGRLTTKIDLLATDLKAGLRSQDESINRRVDSVEAAYKEAISEVKRTHDEDLKDIRPVALVIKFFFGTKKRAALSGAIILSIISTVSGTSGDLLQKLASTVFAEEHHEGDLDSDSGGDLGGP